MEKSSAASPRQAQLEQGLKEGKVSRVLIGEKYYLVYNVERGNFKSIPTANIEKIRKVAQLVLETHKAAAQDAPDLKDKEITHMTHEGANFGEHGTQEHNTTYVSNAEKYLQATDDLTWQKEALALSNTMNEMSDDDAKLLFRKLPLGFQTYLREKGALQNDYPVNTIGETKGLKDHLLDYTREKIKLTHAVDDSAENNHLWVQDFSTVEKAIEESNDFIKQRFTAQHIWDTLVNLANDTNPEIHHESPIEISDESSSRSTTPSSSPSTSRSTTPSRSRSGSNVGTPPTLRIDLDEEDRDQNGSLSPRGRTPSRSPSPPLRELARSPSSEPRGRSRRLRRSSSFSSRSSSPNMRVPSEVGRSSSLPRLRMNQDLDTHEPQLLRSRSPSPLSSRVDESPRNSLGAFVGRNQADSEIDSPPSSPRREEIRGSNTSAEEKRRRGTPINFNARYVFLEQTSRETKPLEVNRTTQEIAQGILAAIDKANHDRVAQVELVDDEKQMVRGILEQKKTGSTLTNEWESASKTSRYHILVLEVRRRAQ